MTQDDVTARNLLSLQAQNYAPAQAVGSNSDAVVDARVREILAQMGIQQQAPVARELSEEEKARANLENAGAGRGVEERLAELYHALTLLAAKVGL